MRFVGIDMTNQVCSENLSDPGPEKIKKTLHDLQKTWVKHL